MMNRQSGNTDTSLLTGYPLIGRSMLMALTAALAAYAGAVSAEDPANCQDITPIYEIQGKGHISPYVDETLTTCGVVTAVGFNFYFLQDPSGDGDAETSDGLFIFTTGSKPDVGDLVHIAGEVSEFIPGGAASGNLSTTQMSFPDIVSVVPGNSLPAPVTLGADGRQPPAEVVISEDELPVNLQDPAEDAVNIYDPANDAIDFYESLEGMLVTINDAVAVSAIRQFGSFSAEVFTLADNGAAASPPDARTANGGIRLQPDPDNRGDQNPERIQVQFDGTVYPEDEFPSIQVGDRLGDITGPVGYSFGNFEVYSTQAITPVPAGNVPDIVPDSTSGELTIASYNVLNLSATDDDAEQMQKIASQIVTNLRSPDIIALQEIQDNNGDIGNCSNDDSNPCAGVLDASETLQALANAIEGAGGPGYAFFNVDPLIETTDDTRDDPDAFGGAALGNIRNAFLYNPERVFLVDFVGLTRDELAARGVTAFNAFDASRDPLQASFDFNGNEITVVNNHFGSRFGSTPIFGGRQPFVQAAEATREAQSLAMHQLVNNYIFQSPDADLIVLGDLNTFEFTNDLTDILSSAEQSNLLTRLPDKDALDEDYSFIFEGNSQSLDHVYVTGNLISKAALDYVHVNVDYPRRSDDVVASDHEPLLASLSFTEIATLGLRGDVYSPTALELFWNRLPEPGVFYRVLSDDDLITLAGTSYFIAGLSPATTYEYTVQAVSEAGEVLAEEAISLTTNNGAPVDRGLLSNVSSAVYSSSAIELFWAADPADFPDELTFAILRDGETVGETDGRSFFEEGLMPATAYEYTIEYLINGVPVESASLSVTTNGEPADTTPLTLSGEVYSSSAIELFWVTANAGATAYQILRDGEILDIRDARSFFDSGLSGATAYDYTVIELDTDDRVLATASISLMTR
ncbi:MAG: endonuclease/exonuclease/phosphatase family protein [Granulosicoccus sp.]